MGIHLVGGGWSPQHSAATSAPFLAEAARRAASDAAPATTVRVLLVVPEPLDSAENAERVEGYRAWLGGSPADESDRPRIALDVRTIPEGSEFAVADLAGAHGLVIGGGLAEAYRLALDPIVGEIRHFVSSGSPYLGFSAGAMIVAEAAMMGGWRIGGVPVCPEAASDDLDDVTIEAGIGLVDLTIDVHAAQWGTLTRLIAAVEAGLVDTGIAIDEDTAFIVGVEPDGIAVAGGGNVWQVARRDGVVVVSTLDPSVSDDPDETVSDGLSDEPEL